MIRTEVTLGYGRPKLIKKAIKEYTEKWIYWYRTTNQEQCSNHP